MMNHIHKPLQWICYLGLIQQLCCVVSSAQSFGSFNNDDVYIMIYETEILTSRRDSPALNLLDQISNLDGVTGILIGQGTVFNGFGGKFSSAKPLLKRMKPNTLVVLSDSRDVLINNPATSTTNKFTNDNANLVKDFINSFAALTKSYPGSVVVSAEAQCCVSALTHIAPGGYFHSDGSRSQRACTSGVSNCLWKSDEAAFTWESFMSDLAIVRDSHGFDDIYLNAGLMAGTAKDLLQLIDSAQIEDDEDDQAVLTDYMFRYPNKIVLDYGQTMFGNNRASEAAPVDGSCVFALSKDGSGRLSHTITQTTPLFVHSPGGNFKCHDKQSDLLGIVVNEKLRKVRQVRSLQTESDQYGKFGSGVSDGQSSLLERLQNRESLLDRLTDGESTFGDRVDALRDNIQENQDERQENRNETLTSFEDRFGSRLR